LARAARMVAVKRKVVRLSCALGGAPEFGAVLRERRDGRIRLPRSRAAAIFDPEHASANEGHGADCHHEEMLDAERELASLEGISRRSEGAANSKCNKKSRCVRWIKPEETVVLFNTGTGTKREAWQRALQSGPGAVSAVAPQTLLRRRLSERIHARVMHCEGVASGSERGTRNVWGLIRIARRLSHVRRQPNDLGKIGDANVLGRSR